MRSIRIHEFGEPDVLKLEDQPTPEPQIGEILVKVQAASVNPVDYKIRNGGYLSSDKLPMTLGRDMSGVVESMGQGVRDFRTGDAVYAMLPRDRGGYAEFVAVNVTACAPKPERLDYILAAAVPLAAVTAWQGISTTAG